MARMTEPVYKSTATGKWHGQYSAKEYSPSEIEKKGGEHWTRCTPEPGEISIPGEKK